jgi:hypothetical protein
MATDVAGVSQVPAQTEPLAAASASELPVPAPPAGLVAEPHTESLPEALTELTRVHGLPVVAAYYNVEQVVLVTTEERARVALETMAGALARRRGWRAPAGVLFSLLIVLLTASFSGRHFFLRGAEWHLIFVLACIGVFVWLVVDLARTVGSRGEEDAVEIAMKELKGGNRRWSP